MEGLKKLGEIHYTFINEYMNNGFNGQDAAIKAGYSKHSAKIKASLLLDDPLIQQELDRLKTQSRVKWNIDRDFIINEYMEIIDSAKNEGLDGKGIIKDRANWLKSTQAIAKTMGLDEPSKIDITSQGKPIQINYIKPEYNDDENDDLDDE